MVCACMHRMHACKRQLQATHFEVVQLQAEGAPRHEGQRLAAAAEAQAVHGPQRQRRRRRVGAQQQRRAAEAGAGHDQEGPEGCGR